MIRIRTKYGFWKLCVKMFNTYLLKKKDTRLEINIQIKKIWSIIQIIGLSYPQLRDFTDSR